MSRKYSNDFKSMIVNLICNEKHSTKLLNNLKYLLKLLKFGLLLTIKIIDALILTIKLKVKLLAT